MNKDQLTAIAQDTWKEFYTWNLTYDELIRLSYVEGSDGTYDNQGDIVYTSPEGHEMSRYRCNQLVNTWHPYLSGFLAGYKLRDNHGGEIKKDIHKETFFQPAEDGIPSHYVVQYWSTESPDAFPFASYFDSECEAIKFEETLIPYNEWVKTHLLNK